MQITSYADYSFRILIYLAMKKEQITTIQEISKFYKISKNHLTRIVHRLGELGFIETIRGKGGGICLARPPESILLKEILLQMEPHFHLVECFDSKKNKCKITPFCYLKQILTEAKSNFISTFEGKTLQDITIPAWD